MLRPKTATQAAEELTTPTELGHRATAMAQRHFVELRLGQVRASGLSNPDGHTLKVETMDTTTPAQSEGDEVTELTGTEGGIWRVYTRDSSHLLDLDKGTVTRLPGEDAKATINDGSRLLKDLVTCRVGERGYWTMRGDYLIDYYFHNSSTIRRIQKVTDERS